MVACCSNGGNLDGGMKFSMDNAFSSRVSNRRRSGPALPPSQWLRDVIDSALDEAAWDRELDPTPGAISSWSGIEGDLTTYIGPFVQATGANQPVSSATSFVSVDGTGREGATFDGVNDRMTLGTLPAHLPTGANPGQVWFIVEQAALVADTATRTLFAYGGTTSGTYRALERRVVDGVNRLVLTDGAADLVDDQVDFSGVHFIRAWFSGTEWGFDLNGEPAQSGLMVPATGTTIARLGIDTAQAGATWHGQIAQFAFLAGDVSLEDGDAFTDIARYYYRP
jgi:hypothetical protein